MNPMGFYPSHGIQGKALADGECLESYKLLSEL